MKNKSVLLGLSGGVDSTAAALLLQSQGYQVTGYYFDVLGGQDQALLKAKKAADQLGIPLIHRTVKEEFQEKVISRFCSDYQRGRTPNPCVLCNPSVKFFTMKEEADRIGAHWLATGHYARTQEHQQSEGFYRLRVAENRRKDQSYMLYRLPQEILQRLLLPLGVMGDKEQVRQLVRNREIYNADAADSQEICFIPDGDYASYLENHGISSIPGNFIDSETGAVLGEHKGIIHYTVGQRKGLGITFGKPMFVTAIDGVNNTVSLGESESLFSTSVTAEDCVFFGCDGAEGSRLAQSLLGRRLMGKIRYAAQPSPCELKSVSEEKIEIVFQNPQRAATPGQSVVLYDESGEYLVGGGYITA